MIRYYIESQGAKQMCKGQHVNPISFKSRENFNETYSRSLTQYHDRYKTI